MRSAWPPRSIARPSIKAAARSICSSSCCIGLGTYGTVSHLPPVDLEELVRSGDDCRGIFVIGKHLLSRT